MVLASTPESTLEVLAELADKVVEVAAPSVGSVKQDSPSSTEVDQLHSDVAWLESLVKPVHTQSVNRYQFQSFFLISWFCSPLQPPYDSPYMVLARAEKFFTLDINGHLDTVSIDRLASLLGFHAHFPCGFPTSH